MTCNKVTQRHVVDQFVPTDKLAILLQLVSLRTSRPDGWFWFGYLLLRSVTITQAIKAILSEEKGKKSATNLKKRTNIFELKTKVSRLYQIVVLNKLDFRKYFKDLGGNRWTLVFLFAVLLSFYSNTTQNSLDFEKQSLKTSTKSFSGSKFSKHFYGLFRRFGSSLIQQLSKPIFTLLPVPNYAYIHFLSPFFKGQLISKGIFGTFKSTKKPTKFL